MTNAAANKSGSIWRRWDLHLHVPGTKLNNAFGSAEDDDVWNRYIDELEASPVQVFGITDYFSCDRYFELLTRYKERHPDSRKVFFPNIEFRLSDSISADGNFPDIHVIFDNDLDVCGEEKLNRFLTNLDTQSIDDASAKLRCSDLKTEAQFESACVSLDNFENALEATFGKETPYLIAFPANNDGLKSTDTSKPRKVKLADRIDRASHVFFGNQKNTEFCLRTDRYKEGVSEPKPVVSGCDVHSFEEMERLTGDVYDFPPTWIKADTTFAGLKQITYEPESRVFIGSEPDVLTRQERDGTKFLKKLCIDQIDTYDEANGQWFKNVELPLNPELTAIIGNKGSGKSAVVDIIGLLGESRQEEHFSFLTDDSKSKKFRQRGFAENFQASITWLTDKIEEKKLSEKCNTDKPETIRYLPQNYFEQLTNEIEIEQFRDEIEDVVFSHVEQTEKLGKSSFSELEDTKTLQSKQEISDLKKRLRELNIEIVSLEEQSSPQYRRQLEAQIEAKQQELEALEKGKPKEVAKPDTETEEQKKLAAEVDRLTALLSVQQEKGEQTVEAISRLKIKHQDAVSLREGLANLDTTMRGGMAELSEKMLSLDLKVEDIISYSADFTPLEVKTKEIQEAIDALEKDNEITFDEDTNFDQLATLPDLRAAYSHINGLIDQLKEQLSTPQRRYQSYQERLNEWTASRLEILGSEEDAKPGTLNSLRQTLKHLDENVAANLAEKVSARASIVENIFESKRNVLNFYSDLKESVEGRLQSVRADGFEIEIDASFIVDRAFSVNFLHQIDQRRSGPFRNDQEARSAIAEDIRETDWNNYESVMAFCDGIISKMTNHDGKQMSVAEQANDAKELYDYLFSLDYLSARYELRLGGKNLNELSPGEKGLLLLIFYLQLDRNNTPLVIDQPEDNLDNESIFAVLAKCIRDAKKHRQVILVTHNPNLAVGADAEQIVYVKLEKPKNYKFSYESGSIENPQLNSRIVDVLEGSQPAFVKRRLKYGIR